MVKSRRNNGAKDPNACLCSRDGREEEGEDGCSILCCRLITVGSRLEPTVIEPNHCRLLAWTGSDIWPSSHCRLETQTGSDSCHHCRFGHISNQFLVFKAKNRQWRVNTVGSPNSGSDKAGSEVLFYSSKSLFGTIMIDGYGVVSAQFIRNKTVW